MAASSQGEAARRRTLADDDGAAMLVGLLANERIEDSPHPVGSAVSFGVRALVCADALSDEVGTALGGRAGQ